MNIRRIAFLLVLVLVGSVGLSLSGSSSATFTSKSTNASTVSAAADWTPPTVSVQNPGAQVKDTVTVTATAADGESGIKDVVIQYLPSGGSSWVTLCTTTAAPHSCSWNTRLVKDGSYDLRAIATDKAGYATTSSSVRTVVANTFLIVLSDPGAVVRGSVPLTVTVFNPSTVPSVYSIEYAVSGTTTWRTITGCGNLVAPYTCSWTTTTIANEFYDLRAVAVTGTTTTYSAVLADVLVDNAAPAVTMTDPGTPLSGTRTFAATAVDADSGVAQVVIQYAVSGTTTYKNLCTVATDPYSCRFDTTTLADGSYTLRAVATDVAGNTTTSATVANRVVDNTVSSVSMEDPGAYLTGTVNLAATASSTATITSVRIQRAPNGSTSWTDVCTDTTRPFTCSWDSATVADGLYDFRAVLLDGSGRTTTSTTVSARRVDNSPLRAVDVQTANGGATPGRLETADAITFTYSEEVAPASVSPGWTGSSPLTVQLRVRDGNVLGLGNTGDTLDVLRAGGSVNLGSVNLKADFVRKNRTLVFNATMSLSNRTVNGATVTSVVVQVGTLASGSGQRTAVASGMVWTPTSAVTGPQGNACSTTPAVETGALDLDF